jgi:transcriptional regulator with XRE-family HTH domain
MTFRDWLEARLRERDWSLAEAARAIGVNQSLLSRYMNGKLNPSRQTLRRFSGFFGVPVGELLAMIDEQDRAAARNGVPPDVEAAGMPRQFLSVVWDRLSQAAKDRIVESVRIEVEEAVARGEI